MQPEFNEAYYTFGGSSIKVGTGDRGIFIVLPVVILIWNMWLNSFSKKQ